VRAFIVENTGGEPMGHKAVKIAMQYQHPELEIVHAALGRDTAVEKRA
jgi:hypothetical protein